MINRPSDSTLAKYGLSLEEWLAFLGLTPADLETDKVVLCPVCEKEPATGRMVTDHVHVAGWKKMPPGQRKKYVRGVVCTTCNHFVLTRYGSVLKHMNAAKYLARYENRRRLL